MSSEAMKGALARAVERWNADDLESYLELYDKQAVVHDIGSGIDGIRQFYLGMTGGLPGSTLIIDDQVAEGDTLVARFRLDGVHAGNLMGIPASGKSVSIAGITIMRFANGRCVERWNQADFLGMLQQIGAIPAPG